MTTPCIPGAISPTLGLGKLTINGINMHNSAWNLPDIRDLWLPRAYRGANVIVPGAAGQRPYPLRIDEGDYDLPMQITGVCDPNGHIYDDEFKGLQWNIEYLEAHVLTPPAAPTATQAATLLMPDGDTRVANVQVGPLIMGRRSGSITFAVLNVRVPSGVFA